jgi:hypothetical protein
MAGAFNAPVRIPIRLSRWLLGGISLAHGGALCLLWTVALPVWVKFLLLLTISTSFIHSMHKHFFFFNAESAVELLLNDEDEWLLTTRKGEIFEMQLHAECYVHPWLVVLPFRDVTRNYTVVLTPDMIDPNLFRRLRVRLRYRKT